MRAKDILHISILCLMGLLVRLYRLPEQSVWHDEWVPLCFSSASDTPTLLHLMRVIVPEHGMMPVYYVLNHFWMGWVGVDPVMVRLLPALLGVLCVGLMYALARPVFGAKTAFVASLCMALSPQHVWHSQEIRPYTLLTVLVLASTLALFVWARSERKRICFVVHCLLNALFLWTHMFAVLALAPMGLYVLFRRGMRACVGWTLINGCLVFLWLVWIFSTPFVSDAHNHEDPPAIASFFAAMLLDDIVSVHTDLLPPWKSWSTSEPASRVSFLLNFRRPLDGGLAILLISGAAFLCLRILNELWQRKRRGTAVNEEIGELLFVLCLIVAPPTVLAALQALVRLRFMAPMYDMYNTIGIYLAVGLAVSALTRCRYWAALVLTALLFAAQLLFLLPYSTRSEWRLAAHYLNTNASPADLVLDEAFLGPRDRFTSYTYPLHAPVIRVKTVRSACRAAGQYFEESLTKPHVTQDAGAVWLVTEPWMLRVFLPEFDFVAALEQGLGEYGLTCFPLEFPGHYNLTIFRIAPVSHERHLRADRNSGRLTQVDYADVLRDIQYDEATTERPREDLTTALEQVVGIWPAFSLITYMYYPLELFMNGEIALAEAMARHVVLKNPSFAGGFFSLAVIAFARDEPESACALFQSAFSLNPSFKHIFGDTVYALLEGKDGEALNGTMDGRHHALPVFPEVFEQLRAQSCAMREEQTESRPLP